MVELLERVRKERRLLHWRELPPIAEEADVDAAERSLFAGAPQLVAHAGVLFTRCSPQVRFEDVEDLCRSCATLIDEDPPQVLNALPHLVQVWRCPRRGLLPVALVWADQDFTERVDGRATDQCCHGVHASDECEFDSMLPPQHFLKERPDPLQQLAFACSWYTLCQGQQGLGASPKRAARSMAPLKLGLRRTPVHDIL